jgi:hypothetical protein
MPTNDPLPGQTSDPSPGSLLKRDVQLTNAQVLALLATPQTLVPAPGTGLANVVDRVHFAFDVTTTGYTLGTAAMKVEYASGADIIDITEAGFLDQATDQFRTYLPAVGAFTPVANSAVRLANETAEFTGGNAANTLSIRVFYRVVPMAAFS